MILRLAAAFGARLFLLAPALAQNQPQNQQNQPDLYTRPLGKGTPEPSPARSLPPASWAAKSRAQVKAELEKQGFDDVIDLHQDANGWVAKAKKDSNPVTVVVSKDGHVTTK